MAPLLHRAAITRSTGTVHISAKACLTSVTISVLPSSESFGIFQLNTTAIIWQIFLQCFDTVSWVIWPVKPVPDMTYNVFRGTLNPTQSINQQSIWRININEWLGALSVHPNSDESGKQSMYPDGDPVRHQNIIICSLAYCQSSMKISCKSIWKFLHKVAERQRNRRTTAITYPP